MTKMRDNQINGLYIELIIEKWINWILTFTAVLMSLQIYAGQQDSVIMLYDTTSNNLQSVSQEDWLFDNDSNLTHITNVTIPRLLVYKPENSCGTGIIICPGGGYKRLNVENTRFIATRLTSVGITVFVLVYSLPINNELPDKSVAGLKDVHTALKLVRWQANEWGLDKNKIGLWGSSAGGHLAAMAATNCTTTFIKNSDTANSRPDFLILAWPVISFRPGLAHSGTMKNLLGDNPTEEQIRFFSADENVNSSSPPTFIVHAGDDFSVPVGNSIRFYEALRESNVEAELHIFQKGGHGFGIAPNVTDSWMVNLYRWMKNLTDKVNYKN